MTTRTGRRRGLFRTAGLLAAGLAALLTVSACGGGSANPLDTSTSAAASGSASGSAAAGGGAGGGEIVVGSANFPESALLANIYAAALTKAGVEASTNLNIGSREVYIKAIEDGSISLVPEYTGVLLQYFDPQATAVSSDDVYAALQKALPSTLVVLDKSAAEDKDAVVVTKATADANNLTSIADLAPVASTFILGGPSEWETRPTGVPGLKEKYGLTFKEFKALDAGGPLTLNALTSDQIQAGNLFTTDPAIPANELVVLEDPKNLFAAQNVLPLLRSDANNPQVAEALNAVSAKLDTATLLELDSQVQLENKDPLDVAKAWLKSAGLG
ncbi:MAG TPA: ABC transporter substrate-binding protein [Micromonosporaceae bacterium]